MPGELPFLQGSASVRQRTEPGAGWGAGTQAGARTGSGAGWRQGLRERRGQKVKSRVAPEPTGRIRSGSVGEFRRPLGPREGQRGASLCGSSGSSSPASRGKAAPSSPPASTSLTAPPGAPLRGGAQAIRGSSGSRSSSSSSSVSSARLPLPGDSLRPGAEDSAIATL